MERPNDYPRAEGPALDALAANMAITRLRIACKDTGEPVCDHVDCVESDAEMRKRVVDSIRQPQQFLPVGRRQRVAIWLSQHGMPTFAHWTYRGYWWRSTAPRFVGELPPRWVNERDVDGGFSWP